MGTYRISEKLRHKCDTAEGERAARTLLATILYPNNRMQCKEIKPVKRRDLFIWLRHLHDMLLCNQQYSLNVFKDHMACLPFLGCRGP